MGGRLRVCFWSAAINKMLIDFLIECVCFLIDCVSLFFDWLCLFVFYWLHLFVFWLVVSICFQALMLCGRMRSLWWVVMNRLCFWDLASYKAEEAEGRDCLSLWDQQYVGHSVHLEAACGAPPYSEKTPANKRFLIPVQMLNYRPLSLVHLSVIIHKLIIVNIILHRELVIMCFIATLMVHLSILSL